jgi:hypothetical protein
MTGFSMESDDLDDPETFPYFSAVARSYAHWLWREYPRSEIVFLQAHLSGSPLDEAVAKAGLAPMDDLFSRFQEEAKPRYALWKLLLTLDFWLITLGGILLLYMVFRTLSALRSARMRYTEIGPTIDFETGVAAESFQGPVFSGTPEITLNTSRQAEPDSPFATPAPPREEVFDEFDQGVEEAFAGLLTSSPPPKESAKKNKDFQKAVDDDVDKLFDQWDS